jgi:polyphosphate kinase
MLEAMRPEVAATKRPAGRFLNRELSWLDFDERILAVCPAASLPVLERAKFFAIFSDNLDEFFQVRVGSLRMQLDAELRAQDSVDENIRQRLDKINVRVRELVARRRSIRRSARARSGRGRNSALGLGEPRC